jgi:hypothetical protein
MSRPIALTLKAGETWKVTFRLGTKRTSRSTGAQALLPLDLTGATARLQARATLASSSTAVDATTVNDQIVINEEQGEIHLVVPPAETADLRGDYVWDLEVTYADDTVDIVAEGTLSVTQPVTRDA